MNTHQFACCTNRSAEDAVILALHYILEKPDTYICISIIDFRQHKPYDTLQCTIGIKRLPFYMSLDLELPVGKETMGYDEKPLYLPFSCGVSQGSVLFSLYMNIFIPQHSAESLGTYNKRKIDFTSKNNDFGLGYHQRGCTVTVSRWPKQSWCHNNLFLNTSYRSHPNLPSTSQLNP